MQTFPANSLIGNGCRTEKPANPRRRLASADGGNGGAFRDIDIEYYFGNFEDMGYLVGDNLIFSQMPTEAFPTTSKKHGATSMCNA